MDDMLLCFGSEIKQLGNGKIGGYGVIFSTEDHPDLVGDFFTQDTDFNLDAGGKTVLLYDHGMDPALGRKKLAYATITKKELGLWVEATLKLRDEYEKAIYDLIGKKKMGFSSGSAGHLVARKAHKKGHEITEWPLVEMSITPTPAEPRTSVVPLKTWQPEPLEEPLPQPKSTGSLSDRLSRYIADLVDDGRDRGELVKSLAREAMMDAEEVEKVLSGELRRPSNQRLKAFGRVLDLPFDMLRNLADRNAPKSIKDLYTERRASQTPSIWDMQSTYCCVVKDIAEAAKASRAVGEDYAYEGPLTEVGKSLLADITAASIEQVQAYVESAEMEEFYLKALMRLTAEDFALFGKSTDFDEHSQLVVTACGEIAARFRNNHEMRKSTKAGRVLSEKNRVRLAKLVEQMMASVTECQALLEETKPMASATEKNAAITRHLRLKHERRQQLGV